jgi:DNA processing protein
LSTRGGSLEADCVVAIVGSREAHEQPLAFAGELAGKLAEAGAVVASGGALGIDGAAHRGALARSGRTWVVAGSGCDHCFPTDHASLYEEVAGGQGAMIWPFAPDVPPRPQSFLARNRVLVALADAVVVVQAGPRSGALHSAGRALALRKPLWVVPTPPWIAKEGYEGSDELLDRGARPLTSVTALLQSLALPCPSGSLRVNAVPFFLSRSLSADESAIYAATSLRPLHLDEIASRASCSAQAASAALLTLALENVVVEGPPGFFRRRDGF